MSEFRRGVFGYRGRAQQVQGVDPTNVDDVVQVDTKEGSLSALGGNDILVFEDAAKSHGWKIGDTIEAQFTRTGKQELRIVGIDTDDRILGPYVINLSTYQKNFVEQLDDVVLVKTAPGDQPVRGAGHGGPGGEAVPERQAGGPRDHRSSRSPAASSSSTS